MSEEKTICCCSKKLERYMSGYGHLILRYRCSICKDTYQPFRTEGGKLVDATLADLTKHLIYWIKEAVEEVGE